MAINLEQQGIYETDVDKRHLAPSSHREAFEIQLDNGRKIENILPVSILQLAVNQ